MARLRVYPATGQTVLDESGGVIPDAGSTVTVTPYYEEKMRRGLLLTESPLVPAGTPIPTTQRAYAVTPEMFGAIGNGSSDDTTAVQTALNYINASGGGTLVLSKLYLVGNLVMYSGTTIVGGGWDTGFAQAYSAATKHYCLSVNPGNDGTSDPDDNVSGIVLRNLSLRAQVASYGFSQFQFLLNLNACSDFLAESVLFYGFRGDGAYLGSSNDGGLERHNVNITFRKCIFDGVNKDNRNAISVIDCTGLLIEDCEFRNCSRTDQPGPIDIEPNPGDAYARIRNITIRSNRFYNCGGNVGFIGMIMWETQSSLTSPVTGILIEDNWFASDNTGPTAIAMIQAQNASASTQTQGVVVRANKARGGGFRAYNIGGMRGIRFLSNDWSELNGGALFGTAGAYKNYDVLFDSGERFYRCAQSSGDAIVLYDNEKVRMANLILDSCGLANGSQGVAVSLALNATTTDIDLSGLTIVAGGRTLSAVVRQSGHTMNTSLNRKKGWRNGGLGSDFVATATNEELIGQVTVNVPSIADGASYTSSPITITGAAFYDACRVSGSQSLKGCQLSAYVSAADTVVFTIVNNTGSAQDLDNMDYTIWVVKS